MHMLSNSSKHMNKNVKYWIWLSSIPGMGAVKFYRLMKHFGNPKALWDIKNFNYLRIKGLDTKTAQRILSKEYKDKTDEYLDLIKKYGINVLTIKDDNYPANLRNIYDPPPVIYERGQLLEQDEVAVAVVGSRKATPGGIHRAEKLAKELAARGVTIVSGMARGIDSAAHRGALAAGGRTIAVLGCGVDTVYPPENRELAYKIISNGAVISEFPPGEPPRPLNFPARNRIISGLSKGVVVVEAGEKSGALITVDFALEQGREVFAVPGNIDSCLSVGTNRMIKDGAKVVTGIDDILEELKFTLPISKIRGTEKDMRAETTQSTVRVEEKFAEIGSDERKILDCILTQPKHIDNIVAESGCDAGTVSSILTMLELKGMIRQLPGSVFVVDN